MPRSAIALCIAVFVGSSAISQAQQPAAEEQPATKEATGLGIEGSGEARRPGSPYEAYEAGLYDEALKGFVDLQVERPDDPEVALNVGSAQYQMRNFPEADRTFGNAAMAQDPGIRGQALYNLGNSAYRQGRLQEAVELYKAALEIDPDDEDAKFNLEFVRDEIRRRHEEAQKRQEQQDQQQQQQEEQQEQGGDGESGRQQQESQPDDEAGNQADQEQQQEQQDESAADRDQDGLSDEQEESAENPTDPDDADSDDDGLPDGAEDLNRNGRVDPGETDPNQADTDGDGIPDSQESQGGEAGSAELESLEGMTPEEAERYLQALQEGRPTRQHPGRGRRAKGDKDW